MEVVLNIVVSNAVLAAILALFAFAVTKVWRNPHLAHALWLLVLIKLVAPPLAHVPWPELSFTTEHVGDGQFDEATSAGSSPAMFTSGDTPSAIAQHAKETNLESTFETAGSPVDVFENAPPAITEVASDAWSWLQAVSLHWPVVLLVVWIGGALVYTYVLASRCLRFRTVLAGAVEADRELLADAQRFAKDVGLARRPDIRVVDARIPPLVWGVGLKPLVLLPQQLLAGLDHGQRQAVLVHELAHIRRRDHFVRWFEVLVLVLFWWNPVAWLARRQIRRAEEQCCDAWVVWALPGSRRSYGHALLRTIEFLTERHIVPDVVGTTFGGFPFKRRIEMIVKRDLNRKMSRANWAVVLLLGAAVLPIAAQTVSNDAPIQQAVAGAKTAPVSNASGDTDEATVAVGSSADEEGPRDGTRTVDDSLESRIRRLELTVAMLAQAKSAKDKPIGEMPSYPIKISPEEVREYSKLTINYQNLRLKSGSTSLLPISCERGITGVLLIGDGTYRFAPQGGKVIEGRFKAAMLRFNPKDQAAIVSLDKGKKVTDRGTYEMSRHLLNDVFRHCWHQGMNALIPGERSIAAVLYSKEHGDLLISADEREAVAYSFTDRKMLYEKK